jgi:hypothetical protein
MTLPFTAFRCACLAAVLSWAPSGHASQEEDCVASILGMLKRTEPIVEEPEGNRSERQLLDLVHGIVVRKLGPNVTVVNEQFDIGHAWEWADDSAVSDGSPLEPGRDWRVAPTRPTGAFTGRITVVGNGPLTPDVVRGRAVVISEPTDQEGSETHTHLPLVRQRLEQAGAAALVVVIPGHTLPYEPFPTYSGRAWKTEGTIPVVFVSHRVFTRWMASEGHSAASALTEPAAPPIHLERVLSGSIALQGSSTQLFDLFAEQPGSGPNSHERVVLLTHASWYYAAHPPELSAPNAGASSVATTVCAVQSLTDLEERRTLSLVVTIKELGTLAYLTDAQTRHTTRIISVLDTSLLSTNGLQFGRFRDKDWRQQLDAATQPSGVTWRRAPRLRFRTMNFPTPDVRWLILDTGSANDVSPDDFDLVGVHTLTDVTTALLTQLLTEPSPTQ